MTQHRTITQLGTTFGGGVERVIETISAGLNEVGRQSVVIYPSAGRAAAESLSARGIEAIADDGMFLGHSPRSLRVCARYLRMLKRRSPAAILLHSNTFHLPLPDVVVPFLLRCPRIVVLVHHHSPLETISRRRRVLTRLSSHLVDRMMVTTDIAYNDLIKMGVPTSKLILIPLGVSEPARRPSKHDARFSLQLPEDKFIICAVSRLDSYKGHEHLLRAVGRLPSELRARVYVVIVGDGRERQHLEALAAELLPEQVKFFGHLPDGLLPEAYACADLFCLPSEDEGFGLVFVEAALHGVPSLTTRAGGIPFAVEHGESGLTVAVGDELGLTASISLLMTDDQLLLRLSAAAAVRAATRFSVVEMTYQITMLFD